MEWISVKDRLPEETDTVLTWCVFNACEMPITAFYGDNWESEETKENLDKKVTHWMPLPEPPKEKSR